MSEKLKCPFCDTELKVLKDVGTPVGLYCPKHCKTHLAMDEEIWKALIAGKKAQDALKSIADDMFLYHPSISEEIPWAEHYHRLKNQARSAITSITKQDIK